MDLAKLVQEAGADKLKQAHPAHAEHIGYAVQPMGYGLSLYSICETFVEAKESKAVFERETTSPVRIIALVEVS